MFDGPAQRLLHALFGSRVVRPAMYEALTDVSFSLDPGQALAVIGRNGAGKSTLLQILAGVVAPSSGSVKVPKRTAGLLELGSGFNPEFTGRENVYLNAAILGMSRRMVDEKYDQIVEFADIGKFVDQPVKTYSSGMFLRLAFSVAINVEPELLLVDEALTVGDVFFQQKCYRRLDELREKGMAVLLVTHSMADAAEFCDRGLVLSNGRVTYEGTGKEAVEYYFHHERQPSTRRSASVGGTIGVADVDGEVAGENANQAPGWTALPECVDLSAHPQFGGGQVTAMRLLIADAKGHPRRVFEQGEEVRVFTEYQVSADLQVPIVGAQLTNAKGVMVHSRNSLQFEATPTHPVRAGTTIVCEQVIGLNIDVGEYVIDVGLADVDELHFRRRSMTPPSDLMSHVRLRCHVTQAAAISVIYRSQGSPCLFTHFGVADLPGRQVLSICGADAVANENSSASFAR